VGIKALVGPVAITNGVMGNRPHCIYRGFCLQGCKVNAKASTLITHVPDALAHKIRQFQSRGRVVLYDEETFSEDNWASVFLGQDVLPRRYDPLVDNFDIEQSKTQLQRIRSTVRQGADSMPAHADFIRKYCAATPSHSGHVP